MVTCLKISQTGWTHLEYGSSVDELMFFLQIRYDGPYPISIHRIDGCLHFLRCMMLIQILLINLILFIYCTGTTQCTNCSTQYTYISYE